jgi:hypothetical protein
MTQEQRQQLYDALMHNSPEDTEALVILEDVVTHDLDLMEPIIDGFIAAAKRGATPTDWKVTELGIDVVPDGTECILHVRISDRVFNVAIDRTRLKSTCEFLIAQSGV